MTVADGGELERRGEALADELQHRHAAVQRHAEIAVAARARASRRTGAPTGRSRPKRSVAAAICSGVAFSPTSTATGPAGHRVDHEKDAGRRSDEHGDEVQEAPEDEADHGCSRPSHGTPRVAAFEHGRQRPPERVERQDRERQRQSGQHREAGAS